MMQAMRGYIPVMGVAEQLGGFWPGGRLGQPDSWASVPIRRGLIELSPASDASSRGRKANNGAAGRFQGVTRGSRVRRESRKKNGIYGLDGGAYFAMIKRCQRGLVSGLKAKENTQDKDKLINMR